MSVYVPVVDAMLLLPSLFRRSCASARSGEDTAPIGNALTCLITDQGR